MINVDAAGKSDTGKVRKANEDRFLVNASLGLFVVADGMGGHRCGALASRMAVETIQNAMAASRWQPSAPASSEGNGKQSLAVAHLLRSIALANRNIHARSVKDESCRGMGTTVAALLFHQNRIIAANVGDSPIYLVRNAAVEELYTPHNLQHERKRLPKSLEGRASRGKLAHVLTRAVGIRQQVRIAHVSLAAQPDDIVVLCSDGLSGAVSKDEIKTLVLTNDPQSACRKLTDVALQRGGRDNITVVVVRLGVASDRRSSGIWHRWSALRAWLSESLKGKRPPKQS